MLFAIAARRSLHLCPQQERITVVVRHYRADERRLFCHAHETLWNTIKARKQTVVLCHRCRYNLRSLKQFVPMLITSRFGYNTPPGLRSSPFGVTLAQTPACNTIIRLSTMRLKARGICQRAGNFGRKCCLIPLKPRRRKTAKPASRYLNSRRRPAKRDWSAHWSFSPPCNDWFTFARCGHRYSPGQKTDDSERNRRRRCGILLVRER
ncbi:MAG: hypothetical protein GPOALKHO_001751 [Sodalis sp.]|nr:MAG: hypothetical protein GPOALKHO_001751 [Sodalis sp.]